MKSLVTALSIVLVGCGDALVMIDTKLAYATVGGLLVMYALVIARPRRSLP